MNTERREQIRKLLATGVSQTDAAKALGLSPTLVGYYARQLGFTRPRKQKRAKDDFAEEIRRLAVNYARPIIMAELRERLGT